MIYYKIYLNESLMDFIKPTDKNTTCSHPEYGKIIYYVV